MSYTTQEDAASRPGTGVSKVAMVSAGAALMFAYVFFVRPAQQQIDSLEGQVNRLVTAVDSLNSSRKDVAAGTSLMARLEAQKARLEAAEKAVARYEALQNRLAVQNAKADRSFAIISRMDDIHGSLQATGDQVEDVVATLSKVDEMHQSILGGRGKLEAASATLGRMEDLHESILATRPAIDAAGVTIDASEAMLSRFDDIRNDLLASGPALDETVSVLGRVADLRDELIDTQSSIDASTAAVEEVDGLLARVVTSADAADKVGRSLDRIDAVSCDLHAALLWLDDAASTAEGLNELCESLAEQRSAVVAADADLDRVVNMESRLASIAANLGDAEQTIVALDDLRNEMVHAINTVGGLRRFMVDLMLLEPTMTRAVQALDPVVEFTQAGRLIGKGSMAILSATSTDSTSQQVIDVAQASEEETR